VEPDARDLLLPAGLHRAPDSRHAADPVLRNGNALPLARVPQFAARRPAIPPWASETGPRLQAVAGQRATEAARDHPTSKGARAADAPPPAGRAAKLGQANPSAGGGSSGCRSRRGTRRSARSRPSRRRGETASVHRAVRRTREALLPLSPARRGRFDRTRSR